MDNSHAGGYAQFSYGFGDVRPYYRYDFLRIDTADTFFPGIEDTDQHTLGFRYDWYSFAAIKVEYRYQETNTAISNEGTAQISFAF